MKRVRLWDFIKYDDAIWQVVAQNGASLILEQIDNKYKRTVGLAELFSESFDPEVARPDVLGDIGLLDTMPPAARENAQFWFRHVTEVLTGRLPWDSEESPEPPVRNPEYDPALTLDVRVAAKVRELRDQGIVCSPRSLQRYIASYRSDGIAGLVDRRQTRQRSPVGRIDSRVVALMDDAIAADPSSKAKKAIIADVTREARAHGLPIPSRSTFYRSLSELMGARTRQPGAAIGARSVLKPVDSAQVDNVLVEIRTGPLGIELRCDDGTLARASLVVMVDTSTSTVCTAMVQAGAAKVSAAMLLARSLVPLTEQPGWKQSWSHLRPKLSAALGHDTAELRTRTAEKPVVVPARLTVDRVTASIDSTFTQAADRLGIDCQFHSFDSTDDSAALDLILAQLTAYLTETQMRLAPTSILTLEEAQEIADQWTVCRWQNTPRPELRNAVLPHRSLSPNEMHQATWGLESQNLLPISAQDYLHLLPRIWRNIHPYGINLRRNQYNTPQLSPYRRVASGIQGGAADRWEVRFDPYRPRLIWLFDHNNARWIECPRV